MTDTPVIHAQRVVGGRKTKESTRNFFNQMPIVVVPPDAETQWRLDKLDFNTLDKLRPHKILELLCDLSPDISRSLWDLLRMANPGWTCKAYKPKTKTIDPRAQEACDLFTQKLALLYGDFNIVANRLFTTAFLRGAILSELVIAQDQRTSVDLATPDPLVIRFDRFDDPIRGQIFRMFQWDGQTKVYLDDPTIIYIPVDPFPGVPYGRSLVSPALFPTLFLLVLMHDVRRVVQQQGWPRPDIKVILDKLQESMPEDLEDDPEAYKKWVGETLDEIVEMYNHLEPDEAYVHTDVVEINRPIGTVDSSSLGGVKEIIEVLERMTVRALKTVAIVLGHADAVSEANANRQWEIYAAGIKALQHLVEVLFERSFEFMLRAQGLLGEVEFRFAELRTAELLRDTQVELLMTKVAKEQYLAGYISQDEAALKAAKKEKADAQEPRDLAPIEDTGAGAAASAQPDPGSTRLVDIMTRAMQRLQEEIDGNTGPETNGHENGAEFISLGDGIYVDASA